MQAVLVGLVGSRLKERDNVEQHGAVDVEFDVQTCIAAEHAVCYTAAVGLLSDSDVARFRTDEYTTSGGGGAALKSCELNASRSTVGVVGLDHEVLSVEGCQQLVNVDTVPVVAFEYRERLVGDDSQLYCRRTNIAGIANLEVAGTGYVNVVAMSGAQSREVHAVACGVDGRQGYVVECLATDTFLDFYLLSVGMFDDLAYQCRVRREAVNLSSGRRCVGLTGDYFRSASAVGAGSVEAEYHLAVGCGFEHSVVCSRGRHEGARVAVLGGCGAINHVGAVAAQDNLFADIAQRGVGSGEHTVHICAAVELIFEPCFLVGEHCVFLAGHYLDSLQAVLVGLVGSRFEERRNREVAGSVDEYLDIQTGITLKHAVGDASAVGLLAHTDIA